MRTRKASARPADSPRFFVQPAVHDKYQLAPGQADQSIIGPRSAPYRGLLSRIPIHVADAIYASGSNLLQLRS